jgi:hypothetical protein
MTVARALLASGFLAMLVACSNPLPADRSAYVGEWEGTGMELEIEQSGQVYYKRVANGGSRSVNMPLVRFEGANFVVGFGPFTTTFVVSKPPHESNGAWLMTVDGVELTRRPGTESNAETTTILRPDA